MLLRIARTVRRAPSLYQASRHESGWSKSGYGWAPFSIGALAAAAGTVAAVKKATSDDDADQKRSNYLRLLKRTLAPTTAMMVSQEDVKTKRKKMEEVAREILKHCDVTDAATVDEVIKEMNEYLDHKQKGSGGITETEKHLINDAIYGPIELSPLLYQIINTKEFQRLKDLRQLGGTHYVYPGANHTRFEHSIGVSYVAGEFARTLKEQLERDKIDKKGCISEESEKMYNFTKLEVLCAVLAGLCHDLGHGPLSHMFEKVMKEKLELSVHHEEISISMFKRLLRNPKVLGEFVYEDLTVDHVQLIGHMIDPPSLEECDKRLFLYEIVANKRTGIDVDKWDYYQRDCHYLGILQDFLWRRTMLLGRILMTPDGYKGKNQLRIAFRDKEMNNLYGMFRTRANIHQKACQHKTIKAVERMYIEAMDLVQDLKIVWAPVVSYKESDSLHESDEGSFKSMKESVKLAIRREKPILDWYMAMTDSILAAIKSAKACTPEEEKKLAKAKELLRRVEERDLYTCSARKRVAKFCPLVNFLKLEHPSYLACKLCAEELNKDTEIKALREMYDDHKECKKFQGLVHQSLLLEERSIIQEDNIWVEVVKIKHPSEKQDNPLDEVIFYKKSRSPSALPETLKKDTVRTRASMVVVPQAFIEYELRVYDKRPKVERKDSHQIALEIAMDKAWRKFLKLHAKN